MVKNILIIGLTQQHAGKTSLGQAFLSYFSDQGQKTCGFKPFSGYNYWYHFDTVHHALSQGKLYSKDIIKLIKKSTIDTEIELLNPIHRLWNEPAIIDQLTSIPPFIMDRFSIFFHGKLTHHLLINQQLIQQISSQYHQMLEKKNYTIHPVETIQKMNDIIKSYYNQAIETCYQSIRGKADVIVIESYADNALLPWNNLSGFDAVYAIKPWEIHKYDPTKYVKAVKLSKPVSAWETSTNKLSELLKPIKVFPQKPTLTKNILIELKKQIPLMLDG